MPSYDSTSAECFVYTFKEGLLSPVAHDLRLRITRFSLDVDAAASSVVAKLDTNSLVVDCPMKDGAENPSALSESDKQKIAGQIREDVLHGSQYPEALFRSRIVTARADGGYDLEGELTLHGVTKPLAAQTRVVAGRQQVELRIHQPDFGITPYRAMLGTLKIQADVTIRVTV
jgi:polyisoprenoid-binding protein YceI